MIKKYKKLRNGKSNAAASSALQFFLSLKLSGNSSLIKNLKNVKATGLDGIGSRILKAPVLSIYLSKIFNCSLATGYVPKC